MTGMSRRTVLGLAGAGAAIAGAGVAVGVGIDRAVSAPGGRSDVVPFRDPHQAGITTEAQDHLYITAFDVSTADRAELVALLQRWTAAAERMTQGAEAAPDGAIGGHPEAPPDDTGEALGLPPARLTLTFGVGPSLFTRFGLTADRPAKLAELPLFRGDRIDPAISGGDLVVQACANDPQVAVHAVRNLVRMGFGTVTVKWSQLGYGRTSATVTGQETPRNLFGFKDGTRNLLAEDTDLLERHVWVQPGDGPDWLAGGSYLVARRIRMMIEPWDRTSLAEQEEIIGRYKGSGAPIGQDEEKVEINFAALRTDGEPNIPMEAHVRLAHADNLGGVRILRRGYNFVDGADQRGHLDAGLYFIAFMRDPVAQFVPMQQELSTKDVLMEYIVHTSSAVFACPPGPAAGGYWGDTLFA
ncbi:iron uptake transporter deferrochelatase/peroxidase subunit [Pseudonocardia sp.]|uniref:iron uptake transporter deferrochelatase/peroxidase subunit n=1 Tax=Pseudonocardia sp. TaxID=60912 RepID=UPI003D0CE5F1